ncbi:hypothetical protein N7E81_05675 [Reichenbachiella carrageenanivorans]|uniref:Uncharacterized protein n=1 Tax=Reichenbachiella carrageenanivorans TaxID=2979869 RepID=A0ABY6D351_9BACT|nr:hypothetical protein [Reichenbachiella carrageenanivorans]UXX80587.1 hypothetical protein N7E81_05675 [Reichenbachiella carrageenanivorans]
MNNTWILLSFAFLCSCLSPEEIAISADDQIKALDLVVQSIAEDQAGTQLVKTVTLDGSQESSTLPFDTLIVSKDLKTLKDYSFARLIRTTNYNKTAVDQGFLYERKAKEKKGPVSILIDKNEEGDIEELELKLEDANLLYTSNQQIRLTFENKKLATYRVQGSRKLIGMEATVFDISVRVQ